MCCLNRWRRQRLILLQGGRAHVTLMRMVTMMLMVMVALPLMKMLVVMMMMMMMTR